MKPIRPFLIVLLTCCVLFANTGFAFSPTAETGAPMFEGSVVQVLPAGSYTYVLVAVGDAAQIWVAAPRNDAIAVGDVVEVPAGLPMPNFHSKALGMDFELIYFVDALGDPKAHSQTVLPTAADDTSDNVAVDVIAKLAQRAPTTDAVSLATLFAGKAEYDQRRVVVQGVVVKFSPEIMGTNWLHIQDGSMNGAQPYDLTVTSDAAASVGDVVVVTGLVSVDKSVGAGYHYDVLIEQAELIAQ